MQSQTAFEREFFLCAGSVLACRAELTDWTDGMLPDGGRYHKIDVLTGELCYAAEMSLLARSRKRAILQHVARRLLKERH